MKNKKVNFETMLRLFDEIWIKNRADPGRSTQEWRKALVENGWVDEEFDRQLTEYYEKNKKIVNKAA